MSEVTSRAVADNLAKLNSEVYRHTADGSVGPSCIVAWRNRKGGYHRGGGGDQSYTDGVLDAISPPLPIIANGMDIRALVGVLMPNMEKMIEAARGGEPPKELDKDELNAVLARLPHKANEEFR
jgi:hypothetical protein